MIKELVDKQLLTPPTWLPDATCYETIMGSYAYGASKDNSDTDVYGFCVPPKEIVFPHTAGVIQGFGDQGTKFDQYQQHHVIDHETGKEYDFSIYNIVRYFDLCMDCNPNMIDSVFTPDHAVLTSSKISQIVRNNRSLFLSKIAWATFRGYAYSQLMKLANRIPTGHRARLIEEYGYDVKYAYHLVRLLDEAEQILTTHDIDLTRDKDRLQAIRRGEWTASQVLDFFKTKSTELDKGYEASTLRDKPDEAAIKNVLLACLEEAYGSLQGCIIRRGGVVSGDPSEVFFTKERD